MLIPCLIDSPRDRAMEEEEPRRLYLSYRGVYQHLSNGLDHRVGHPWVFRLPSCSLRRTEGCRGYLDGSHDHSKHRPGLLPEKPLRRGRPVRTCEEKIVYCRQTRALSRVVEASQLMIPEREVPVAPFHVRAGALEHVSQLGRLCLQLTLLSKAQVTQCPAGRKERRAQALG